MNLDISTILSALIGTTIPGLVVSIILLLLNHKNNKAIEKYKAEIAKSVSEIQHDLSIQNSQLSVWHEKRVNALIEIYDAFRLYLDFLRRALYVPDSRENLDGMWDFRKAIDKNLVFLNDDLQQMVENHSVNLLKFWNWAQSQERGKGNIGDSVQQKLDYEIPAILEELRVEINKYTDPKYFKNRTKQSTTNHST